MDEEEDASHLRFGKHVTEYTQFATNDDIYCLLAARKGEIFHETGQKVFDYLEKVVTKKDSTSLQTIAGELTNRLEEHELELRDDTRSVKLHKFEQASLRNLIRNPDTSLMEVVTWIPSLERFKDEDVMAAVSTVVEIKERVMDGI